MATGRAKEGVSSPINTHTRAWQLDSPPLAPAAARWLPRAAPRAGGAGAQRRRGPGGARGEAVLGRGASPACLWEMGRAGTSGAGQPHLGKAFI